MPHQHTLMKTNIMNSKEDRYIVGLGEVLWDILPDGRQLGGAPANFAYHAGQHGLKSVAVSALGHDLLAKETETALKEKNLHYVMPHVDFPTGTVQVTLDAEGVPSYNILTEVAWDNIPFTAQIRELATHAQAVCWGSLAQRSETSRHTIRRFLDHTPDNCLKIFDINLRQHFYTVEIICESLQRCNILKINDEELSVISRLLGCPKQGFENICRYIMDRYNLDMLVLTCGVNGSYVFAPGFSSYQETPKVTVADTVGAGDSFTGTFCAAILKGRSMAEAHRLAVEVSAYVCTQNGAMPQIPEQYVCK